MMEEFIENNKLIAEFMGGEFKNGRWWFGPIGQPETDTPPLYNEDWNWLMPVVDEIEHGKGCPWFTFKSEVCIKEGSMLSSKTIVDVKGILDRKEAYYKACVEFIKLYNKTKE